MALSELEGAYVLSFTRSFIYPVAQFTIDI
jgi:hypothetical protein